MFHFVLSTFCRFVLRVFLLSLLFVRLLLVMTLGRIQLPGSHWWRHFAQADVITAYWLFH